MTFLKKLGQILKIVGQVAGFIPLVNAVTNNNPTVLAVEDKLQKALAAVTTVEQAFNAAFGGDAKKGSEKLAAATPFVAQIIQQTDLLIGKHPSDEAKFTDAATRLTAALADILNSYGD